MSGWCPAVPVTAGIGAETRDRYGLGVTVRIGVRCDVGPTRGVGHVMRSLALAEELVGRGAEVVFVCDSHTVPWANDQILARDLPVEPAVWTAGEHLELFARLGLDAVVFDSYDLDAEVFTAVRKSGIPTLAIVDGDLRGAEADLYVDQNLGSELDQPVLPRRDQTRRTRLRAAAQRDPRAAPGGTTCTPAERRTEGVCLLRRDRRVRSRSVRRGSARGDRCAVRSDCGCAR